MIELTSAANLLADIQIIAESVTSGLKVSYAGINSIKAAKLACGLQGEIDPVWATAGDYGRIVILLSLYSPYGLVESRITVPRFDKQRLCSDEFWLHRIHEQTKLMYQQITQLKEPRKLINYLAELSDMSVIVTGDRLFFYFVDAGDLRVAKRIFQTPPQPSDSSLVAYPFHALSPDFNSIHSPLKIVALSEPISNLSRDRTPAYMRQFTIHQGIDIAQQKLFWIQQLTLAKASREQAKNKIVQSDEAWA